MALSPLASTADLEARGVTVDASEADAVAALLDVASTVVRDAAGSPISQTTSTIVLEGTPTQRLHLPGQPVQSVASVAIDGQEVEDWRLASGALFRAAGWGSTLCPSSVEVTYTHGLAEVPADIVDIVCRLVGQALVSFRESPEAALSARPVIQERIGDYSVTYSYSPDFSPMELPKYLRARLAARFGNAAGTVVKSR